MLALWLSVLVHAWDRETKTFLTESVLQTGPKKQSLTNPPTLRRGNIKCAFKFASVPVCFVFIFCHCGSHKLTFYHVSCKILKTFVELSQTPEFGDNSLWVYQYERTLSYYKVTGH